MNIYLCSDLHLGHKNVIKWSQEKRPFNTIEEHDEFIMDEWSSKVKKRDHVWVLGDLGHGQEALSKIKSLPGFKKLVKGNHDQLLLKLYAEVFHSIHGIVKYKNYWFSHCPIHPAELRGRRNIHGHVHNQTVLLPDGTRDDRYLNMCMENRDQFQGTVLTNLNYILEHYPAALPEDQ